MLASSTGGFSKQRPYLPSKHRVLFTSRYGILFQKVWISFHIAFGYSYQAAGRNVRDFFVLCEKITRIVFNSLFEHVPQTVNCYVELNILFHYNY